jgi:probable phosphoglycerate mutase
MGGRVHLVLVRHGQPQPGITRDPPLSPLGAAQAMASAKRLAPERFDAILSSGMARADATAAPLAQQLGLPLIIEPRLGEVDRVTGEYGSIEAVRARGAAEWERFMAAPLAYFGVDAARFRADVLAGLASALQHGGRVAIFTHGFPINIILAHALGIGHDARFVPAYGSISRLAGHDVGALTVLSVNETAHFAPDGPR